MAVTSHDVARAAGVSQPTVSRALRGDPRVAPATAERVRAAAAELRYIPSELGRSLSTRSTRTLGMVVGDLTSPFYHSIVAPLHEALERHGYRMVLLTDAAEAQVLQRLICRSLDGVVLAAVTVDSDLPYELAQRDLPFVFLNRYADDVAADCVIADNALGGSLIGGELVRLGHRRIGAIFGPANTSTGRDRERGFRAALTAAGIALDESLVRYGEYTYETGYDGILELLGTPDPPTAVFCADDMIAIGALNGTTHAGVGVPGDVALVGFDDIPLAQWEMFGLATVRQPMVEMANTAAELLVERLQADKPLRPRRRVFEPTFVSRRTLAPPRNVS
ncbi:LacI family DNA-binding transcriptional regulator [Streptomyces sp. NPDC001393]